MLGSNLLMGRYTVLESLHRFASGEFLRAAGADGAPTLLFVATDDARALRERRLLRLLACPGVPAIAPGPVEPGPAVAFVDAGAATPLCEQERLPPPTLRAGLGQMLSVLSHVHARGFLHGAISPDCVLADPFGRFWLAHWSGARRFGRAAGRDAAQYVTEDLRALARVFFGALTGATWGEGDDPAAHAPQLEDVRRELGPDFARVLSRMLTRDLREVYRSASEVLADLGCHDASIPEPWRRLPYVGDDLVSQVVLDALETAGRPASATVEHIASVQVVGPHGAGKSRALQQVAQSARAAGILVLQAEGGAPGHWGGLGDLVRQVLVLVPPASDVRRRFAHAIDCMTGASDDSPAEPPPDTGDSHLAEMSTAVTELVRATFTTTSAVLLLDDEDDLDPFCRRIWHTLGRYVMTVNDAGGAVRALAVGASQEPLEEEIGTPRTTVELPEWELEQVEDLLARLLAEPVSAQACAKQLHPLVGGRPGDVIEYLRHLERQGHLLREATHWRLDVTLHHLPAWTGGTVEFTRRALAECGHDGRSVAEVLAVADDLPLAIPVLCELAEVPRARIWAAAESARAAGLIARSGPTWRIRSGAIRARCYAALPDTRRHGLHRELLVHLLDADPSDLSRIALHSRRSADPAAADHTRAAVSALHAAGDLSAAIQHLEDAEQSIPRSAASAEWRLDRARLHCELGHLQDGIRLLQAAHEDASAPPAVRIEATAELCDALYKSAEFETLLSVELPKELESREQRCRIRLLRATAHAHLDSSELATRELRLAEAELVGCPPSPAVACARLRVEYALGIGGRDWNRARGALLQMRRSATKAGLDLIVQESRAKYANVLRLLGRYAKASAQVRGLGRGNAPHHLRESLATTASILAAADCRTDESISLAEEAVFHAVQSGAHRTVETNRLRLLALRLQSGRVQVGDHSVVKGLSAQAAKWSPIETRSRAFSAATSFLYFARERELAALSSHVSRGGLSETVARFHAVCLAWLCSPRLGHSPQDVLDRTGMNGAIAGVSPRHPGHWAFPSVPAYFLRTGLWNTDTWPKAWTIDRLLAWSEEDTWCSADLALAVALWAPVPFSDAIWSRLVSVVLDCSGPLPLALEWQRHLVEAHDALLRGDWRRAKSKETEALRNLNDLGKRLTPEAGLVELGRRLPAWTRCAEASPKRKPRSLVSSQRGAPKSDPIWRDALRAVSTHRRAVVWSVHVRELAEFWNMCLETGALGNSSVLVDQLSPAPSGVAARAFVGLFDPSSWTEDRVRTVIEQLHGNSLESIVALLAQPVDVFRAQRNVHRQLLDVVDHARFTLPPLCGERAGRNRALDRLLAHRFTDVVLTNDARCELLDYDWPGGLGELESVLDGAVSAAGRVVTGAALDAIGWGHRSELVSSRARHELEVKLVGALRDAVAAGCAELALRVGAPKRSVVRHLCALVRDGIVRRTGRARATRYTLVPPGQPARL